MENKIIHEFFYMVGYTHFAKHYELRVDRETNKMLYGQAFHEGKLCSDRFAINKSTLNKIHQMFNQRNGLVYRLQIDDGDYKKAYAKAKDIIYEKLIQTAEEFKAHQEEN